MLFVARLHDFIPGYMLPQSMGHMLPSLSRKTELVKEARFAAPGGVGGIEQVATNLRLGHLGFICVWDFHVGVKRLISGAEQRGQ